MSKRMTREEQLYRKRRIVYLLSILLWLIALIVTLIYITPEADGVSVEPAEPPHEIFVVKQAEPVGNVPATEYAAIPDKATELDVIATAYCSCRVCCGRWSDGITASGTVAMQGRTIATDPSVIPTGSKVIYRGHEYVAEDTGSAIKGNRIDIYYDSHQDAKSFGVNEATIYVLNEEEI